MTLSNMQLEDVLNILGRVGSVTLRKGTNDVSATPGHVADTTGWSCELSLAGYIDTGGMRQRLSGRFGDLRHRTALRAALDVLEELEIFLGGEAGKASRRRYEHHHQVRVGLTGRRSDCFHSTYADPGPMVPEARIEWGD